MATLMKTITWYEIECMLLEDLGVMLSDLVFFYFRYGNPNENSYLVRGRMYALGRSGRNVI